MNVISQWIRPVRLVVIGDIIDDSFNNNQSDNQSDNKRSSRRDSASDYARQVIDEIAALTGLIVGTSSDSYVDAKTYLQAIKRSDKFTLSDCASERPALAEPESDQSDSDQTDLVQTDPEQTEQEACANFFVIFASLADMEAVARAIPLRPVYQKAFANPDAIKCFFSPFQTGYLEIRQALVFIRDDLPRAMVDTCLQEEIYQSFGMFNDSTDSRYYSFNNRIEPKAITRYDRALLETIYDPQFRPGAPVFAVVKRLMERLGFDPFVEE